MRFPLRSLLLATALALACDATAAEPQSAALTYQGQIQRDGQPFTGLVDLDLRLFDADSGGIEIRRFDGPEYADYPVQDGLLQIELPLAAADFDGNTRWLEIHVDGVSLTPRQRIASTPYATRALSVNALALDGTELRDGAVAGAKLANAAVTAAKLAANSVDGGKIADASIKAADIDANQIQRRLNSGCGNGAISAVSEAGAVSCTGAGWALGGNADTDPAQDFLGTLDETPLVLGVNGKEAVRVLPDRVEFTSGGAPVRVEGASLLANPDTNSRDADYAGTVVLGGGEVRINGVLASSGNRLVAPSAGGELTSHFASIGGGTGNRAAGVAASIGGGSSNVVDGDSASVSGGQFNEANGRFAHVGGGSDNSAADYAATIAGGESNIAGWRAFVGGGVGNQASNEYASIGGGNANRIEGARSTIAGGDQNTIGPTAAHAAIGGGDSNRVSGAATHGVIGGGTHNEIDATRGTIGGGGFNRILGGADNSLIAGGSSNTSGGKHASVGGGTNNCAGGDYSWAGGRFAKIRPNQSSVFNACAQFGGGVGTTGHQGVFLWADASNVNFISAAANEFAARATGGVRFVTAINTGTGAATAGVALAAGSGTWTSLSDRHAKTDIRAVEPAEVLAGVLALPIYAWRYRAQDESIRHMGPMAQDFHAAFGLNGEDDTSIATVDPDGVALAAIQALHAELSALRERVDSLERENRSLRSHSSP